MTDEFDIASRLKLGAAGSGAGATPRPWFIGTMNDALFIIDQRPHPVPIDVMTEGGSTRVIAKMGDADMRADADAALIVRAVNSFDALVEALQHLLDGRAACRDKARRALALALAREQTQEKTGS